MCLDLNLAGALRKQMGRIGSKFFGLRIRVQGSEVSQNVGANLFLL